jgi:hypothetical protein
MGTSNTQRPSQGTTYSTASNAGKSGNDEALKNKKPLREEDESQSDIESEENETENKEWK